jgi:hypothetical protein
MGYCKCSGEGCPMKEKCFRYTFKGNKYFQSWFAEVPINEYGTCKYFLPVEVMV